MASRAPLLFAPSELPRDRHLEGRDLHDYLTSAQAAAIRATCLCCLFEGNEFLKETKWRRKVRSA